MPDERECLFQELKKLVLSGKVSKEYEEACKKAETLIKALEDSKKIDWSKWILPITPQIGRIRWSKN